MILHSNVRDCLYLNWALPVAALPELPHPLRYDRRSAHEGEVVFASALLFRQQGPGVQGLPLPRLDAPQFQLHVCTLDGDSAPSTLIVALLVPSWMAPGARLLGRQPARGARLEYPVSTSGSDRWRWSVQRNGGLVVEGQAGSPGLGSGPSLGTWEQTVQYFRRRGIAYAVGSGGLTRTEIKRPRVEIMPVKAEVLAGDLLLEHLPGLADRGVPGLHSAWLCAPMEVVYDTSGAEHSVVGSRVPAPG